MNQKVGPKDLGADRIDADQRELLSQCAQAGSAEAWNKWRQQNPQTPIWLRGADLDTGSERIVLRRINMRGANLARAKMPGIVLVGADLRRAILTGANLQRAVLVNADLRGAQIQEADLRGANFRGADLRDATCAFAKVDGETLLVTDKVGPGTDFTGVALHSARTEPGLQQLLEYNVRRRRWREWYGHHPLLALPVRLFWLTCDYGRSTWRIVISFALLAVLFALAYTAFPESVVAVWATEPERQFGLGNALYFSIVTMTTLGFGDVYASPDSALGQFLLSLQVVLGYVLLGALVTRIAQLFAAGGPSASYYKPKDKEREHGASHD